jgi:CsoR family transcriptional regulator, copper-sensing transcriptional repressor
MAHVQPVASPIEPSRVYPSHADQLERLSKIEGQIKGIRRMIEERRYCMDILPQIRAVHGGLHQVEMGVLETHVHHCVQEAVESQDGAAIRAKIDEILKVLGRIE